MTAGTASALPLRSLCRQRTLQSPLNNNGISSRGWATARTAAGVGARARARARASLGSPYRLRPPSAVAMFKRANATYEAKTKAPQPQQSLAKQLFPSSSPTPRHDANIKDHFQKLPGTSFAQSRTTQTSKPAGPLQLRSLNPPKPDPVQHHANSKPFASIYSSNQNSFKEEPDVVDLTGGDTKLLDGRKSVANVDIYEDDFSDDEDLDLDYQCPAALPPQKPQSTPPQNDDLPARDDASTLSWSQSSPSHFHAARSISEATDPHASTKRPGPDDGTSAVQPVAKKRTLPWPQRTRQLEDNLASASSSSSVSKPQSRSRELHTWNLTPEAVKAQQKKLKDKTKKTTAPGTDATVEEIQQVVTSHTVKQSAISLSNEQELVKELVCDKNQSVFFTGPAGTGKSVLMRAIIAQLKKKYARDPERLSVTASTGLAACNIGGMTLHSFSGIGLGKDDVQTLVRKIRRNPKVKTRWLKTKVLIIDEISMVDGDLFDKLSQIGRTIRNNGRPWGGIQLVITGDFFQLPPIPDYNTRDTKFAFEAATWNTSIDHTIGLTEVFRQKDPVFADMLNEMRLGRISEKTVKTFKSLSRPLHFNDGLEVTELFPTRNEVETSNQRRLRALPGDTYRYDAQDTGDPATRDKLLGNMMAPKVLELKKGAQVMLIKNLDETLVNGSLGTVIGFSTEDAFQISGGFGFEDGHADNEMDPKIKKRLAAFSRELNGNDTSNKRKFPMVQFHAVDGSARIILCVSEPWKVETPTGEVQAQRDQLPLILAWALSIHKAQGQTLARVKVDLGKVFEKGQAYVALSRATTQEGLQVLRFDKQKVMAHPRVVSFYQKLYSAESAAKPKKTSVPSITSFAYKWPSKTTTARPSSHVNLDEEEEAMAAFGQ